MQDGWAWRWWRPLRDNYRPGTCERLKKVSIDVIASILPYDRYVAAETFLSLSQVPGRFGTMFQSPEQARAAINDLRRAQAEGEVRCF